MQSIIVGILVLIAVFYVAKIMLNSAKGKACGSGNCGCSSKPTIKT